MGKEKITITINCGNRRRDRTVWTEDPDGSVVPACTCETVFGFVLIVVGIISAVVYILG